jgi:hypothetical protein
MAGWGEVVTDRPPETPPPPARPAVPSVISTLTALRQRLRALGANPAHEERVLRLWANALPQTSGRRRLEDFMPQALRNALPALDDELQSLARIRSMAAMVSRMKPVPFSGSKGKSVPNST